MGHSRYSTFESSQDGEGSGSKKKCTQTDAHSRTDYLVADKVVPRLTLPALGSRKLSEADFPAFHKLYADYLQRTADKLVNGRWSNTLVSVSVSASQTDDDIMRTGHQRAVDSM